MSERDEIDMKSGEHREAADPSREEQLSLLLTITMEVAAASDLASALDVVLGAFARRRAGSSDRLGCRIRTERFLSADRCVFAAVKAA